VLVALAVAITVGILAVTRPWRSSPHAVPAPPARKPTSGNRQHAPTRKRPTVAPAPSRQAVPILMYHVIAPAPASAPYPGLYVPAGEFAAQMRALAAAGYRAVTLDQVRAAWLGRARLPAHPLVLSFDNGYRTQYTHALPVLRRLGWVGVENLQLSGLPVSQGGLSPREVRRLVAAGWELDTQGFSHADLIRLDPGRLHYEVAVARSRIRRLYGVPANWFCYPSGHYDATVLAAVAAAGYLGATTVAPGWAKPSENQFRLPRLRILAGTTPGNLLAQIAGNRRDDPPPSAYPLGA